MSPRGHRYAVDCAWTDAPAADLAPLLLRPLRDLLDTEHSFSIWYGWRPSGDAARHGVLVEGTSTWPPTRSRTDPADDERSSGG